MVCRPNLYARGTDWPGKRTSLWTVECKEAYGLYTFLPVLNLVLSAFENLSLTSGLFFFSFCDFVQYLLCESGRAFYT